MKERGASEPNPPISREIFDLFDRYVHGSISRRSFLRKTAIHAGGAAAAAGVLAILAPDFAKAQVPANDPRIRTTRINLASPDGYGSIRVYVARPAGHRAKLPAVLVVHENRGLNPHIEDIARRLALAGYVAYAPDALTPLGGYPGNEDEARELFSKLDQRKTTQDFIAVARALLKMPDGNGKVGVVGFCYGGGMANRLVAEVPEIRAGSAFYGAPAPLDEVGRIRAELALHFAGNDKRVNGMFPPFKAALEKAGVKFKAYTYPGVEHGFNNDTTPRYNPEAARLAWQRTLDLFRRRLR